MKERTASLDCVIREVFLEELIAFFWNKVHYGKRKKRMLGKLISRIRH